MLNTFSGKKSVNISYLVIAKIGVSLKPLSLIIAIQQLRVVRHLDIQRRFNLGVDHVRRHLRLLLLLLDQLNGLLLREPADWGGGHFRRRLLESVELLTEGL